MKNRQITKTKKGFTLIELIVVMAVLGILVLLAAPKFIGYTKKAELAKLQNNIKVVEDAAEIYHLHNEDWPRLTDVPYSAVELQELAGKYFDETGEVLQLDPNGNYYNIDWDKMSSYMIKPKDAEMYVLQNPVGEVFYMKELTPTGQNRVDELQGKEVVEVEPEIQYTDASYFTFDATTGTITGYSPEGPKNVVIPTQIEEKDVIAIGTGAFNSKSLQSVFIPPSVKRVERMAFYNNKALTELTLSEGLEQIIDRAFLNTGMTEINLPKSLTSVNSNSFAFTAGSPSSPSSNFINYTEPGIYRLNNGEWTNGPIEAPTIVEFGDYTFDTKTGSIIKYSGSESEVVIPNKINEVTVAEIKAGAFTNPHDLVTIPASITLINTGAFIPDSLGLAPTSNGLWKLTKTARDGFGYSTKWQKIDISSNGIIQYQNYLFDKISGKILNYTGAENSAELIIPSQIDGTTVVSIGGYAFSGIRTDKLIIPETITTINTNAFSPNHAVEGNINSTGLWKALVKSSGSRWTDYEWKRIDISSNGIIQSNGFWFDKTSGKIINYEGLATDLVIPSQIDGVTVTAIGGYAFTRSNITSYDTTLELKSVTIPSTIISIDANAFKASSYIEAQPTSPGVWKKVVTRDLTYADYYAWQLQ